MPISFCAAVHGEFSQFLQVIFWVFISIVTLSVTAAVIMHYRKRNQFKNLDQEEIQQEVENLAERFCYKTADGKFVYLDHTGLLQKLHKKLSYSNAKFAALQQDYKKLKYSLPDFNLPDNNNLITKKKNSMENFQNNIDIHLHQEETQLHQIGMQVSDGVESDSIVSHLVDENKILKAQLAEQEYYRDLLEEKKMQIDFLQSQIDLRVKKHHDAEQEHIAGKNEMELVNSNLTAAREEAASLKNEVSQKQDDIQSLLLRVNENETELNEAKQTLQDKQAQIIYVENVLLELRQQNELFNAAAADGEERNKFLQTQLEIEEAKIKILEQKLKQNRQLMQRLYNEFSICLNEDNDESPVIALRPDYTRVPEGWEETAVQ